MKFHAFAAAGLVGVTALPSPVSHRPVVLWHGLGDSYDSLGMINVKELIEKEYPGIYVHSVHLDEDSSTDSRMSFFGDVNEAISTVCDQLSEIPELADGFDAIGFSQGGLFLRAYAERCNDPPLRKLVTYGSPHNGIADLPTCEPGNFWCHQRNRLMKSQLWGSYVQTHVVAAQYYRDPENIDIYLENSRFLADINNEREIKNSTYGKNLSTLEQLVLVLFTEDETVVPKESAWLQEVNKTSGEITHIEKRKLYKEDWIGIKRLVDEDLIDYLQIQGAHMQITDEHIRKVAKEYLGTAKLTKLLHQS